MTQSPYSFWQPELLNFRMHRLTSQGLDDPQVADGRQMSQVEDTGFNLYLEWMNLTIHGDTASLSNVTAGCSLVQKRRWAIDKSGGGQVSLLVACLNFCHLCDLADVPCRNPMMKASMTP